jgi:1-pyrroline-5-carboxylate dehydrogenase
MTYQNEQTKLTHERDGRIDEYHAAYEAAVEAVRDDLGGTFPLRIDGEDVTTDETFTVYNPGDRDEAIGTFAFAKEGEVDRAVAAAREAYETWSRRPYRERVEIFQDAADVMRDRKFELSALLTLENGKNRDEAVADVDEAIDFLDFYSQQLDENDGFIDDTGRPNPWESTESVLRPYGVFGVIPPFNFPAAITTGMTAAALVTGNAVVLKPAKRTPRIAHAIYDVLQDAGLPDGVLNLVTGRGSTTGQPILDHPGVDGIAFTGSRSVGMAAKRSMLEKNAGPVVAELGGKNPTVVTETADVEAAIEGIWKGSFSFCGQKCSATSRLFAHESVYDEVVEGVVEGAEAIEVGPAEHEDHFMGPVIEEDAVETYREAVEAAAEAGATIAAGGEVLEDGDRANGYYVRPTVITDLPEDHWIWQEELFLPILAVDSYSDWDEMIDRVNGVEYGLTGGIFTGEEDDWERFFDEAEIGTVYANRRSSSTTGALVQAQPFVGWKMSGTTGKAAGGKYYLQQFLREQSRTVWSPEDETRDPPATK